MTELFEGQGCWLGVDLGGTKILAAVVDADGNIVSQAKQRTMADMGPDSVIERIVDTARKAIEPHETCAEVLVAAGVGAPAPVDVAIGTVYGAPNLAGWGEIDLGPRLEEALGIPTFVDNDVNLGTLGEFERGAGQGTRHMVGVFVGTGVGGGVIVDGRLFRGFRDSAGEVGHMIVLPNGPLCGCGRRGCLEALASRTAMERDIRAGIDAGRGANVAQLIASSKRQRLTSGVIKKAVDAGDELTLEVIDRAQFYLGILVANIVNFFDPQMVVFGGGVVEALGDRFLEPIRQTARANFKQERDADQIRIVPAILGDYAAVHGAAILASQQLAQSAAS
jgi:glucokinase